MIGPVRSYQQIYVAACGQDFPDGSIGRKHESECCECQSVIEEHEIDKREYDEATQ